tara:strand:+ start:127 stop:357 length:231 start_codon:yes stop_codon:yes gene_type:complete
LVLTLKLNKMGKIERINMIIEITDNYIEKLSNELTDAMMDSGDYEETDDKFIKDFQHNYLNITNKLLNNAIELILE